MDSPPCRDVVVQRKTHFFLHCSCKTLCIWRGEKMRTGDLVTNSKHHYHTPWGRWHLRRGWQVKGGYWLVMGEWQASGGRPKHKKRSPQVWTTVCSNNIFCLFSKATKLLHIFFGACSKNGRVKHHMGATLSKDEVPSFLRVGGSGESRSGLRGLWNSMPPFSGICYVTAMFWTKDHTGW